MNRRVSLTSDVSVLPPPELRTSGTGGDALEGVEISVISNLGTPMKVGCLRAARGPRSQDPPLDALGHHPIRVIDRSGVRQLGDGVMLHLRRVDGVNRSVCWSPMSAAKETVIVAYDGSAASREAIVAAAKLLKGCRVLVVTVWEEGLAYMAPPATPTEGMMMTQPVDPEVAHGVDVALHSEAEQMARTGAEMAGSLGLQAEPVALPDARNVADTLIDLAREQHAAAIVVGSRGLGGIRARLEGSTSKALLAHAPCPVLVVHHTE
jgi:nucleotide-binding universal stress UspA family protein